MVWKLDKRQSRSWEAICFMLNGTFPCTNSLCQLFDHYSDHPILIDHRAIWGSIYNSFELATNREPVLALKNFDFSPISMQGLSYTLFRNNLTLYCPPKAYETRSCTSKMHSKCVQNAATNRSMPFHNAPVCVPELYPLLVQRWVLSSGENDELESSSYDTSPNNLFLKSPLSSTMSTISTVVF